MLISKNPGKSRYSKEEEQHCQALMPLKHCEVRLCSQSTRPRGDCTVGMIEGVCSSLPHRHCPHISLLIFIYFLSYSLYYLYLYLFSRSSFHRTFGCPIVPHLQSRTTSSMNDQMSLLISDQKTTRVKAKGASSAPRDTEKPPCKLL